MSDNTDIYGGIEAGGTKFVCITASGPRDIRARTRINTTTPAETLEKLTTFFKTEMQKYPLKAIGIGSFGPLDLDPDSPTFGYITSTPKPGWQQVDLAGIISQNLGIKVEIDTDVNAAALGEGRWGAAAGLRDFLYLTVGTGIGGGAVVNGRLIHGLLHPEMGHLKLNHDMIKDPFKGCCPFHADCLEGLASGVAIQKRWGIAAENLPPDHPAWELEAGYLAEGIMDMICVLSPRKIILGGGVAARPQVLSGVHRRLVKMLNGYFQTPFLTDRIEEYVVAPGLGDLAGVMGSIVLAGGGK